MTIFLNDEMGRTVVSFEASAVPRVGDILMVSAQNPDLPGIVNGVAAPSRYIGKYKVLSLEWEINEQYVARGLPVRVWAVVRLVETAAEGLAMSSAEDARTEDEEEEWQRRYDEENPIRIAWELEGASGQ